MQARGWRREANHYCLPDRTDQEGQKIPVQVLESESAPLGTQSQRPDPPPTPPHQHTHPLTSAVPEIAVAGWVVFAQSLQDLLVVHEPVQRAQEEGVERQVAHLLQLEVSAQALQPPGAPDAGLQRLQRLAVLPQVSSQLLVGKTWEGAGAGAGPGRGGESGSAMWSTQSDSPKASPLLSLSRPTCLISCFYYFTI